MNFPKTLLASVIALSLSACGGDSSSDSGTTTPNESNVAHAGKAADGYLQYANVCLDLNNNKSCDDDEPSATTDVDGSFTLDVTQKQLDLHPLLVEVVANQTIDSDAPGVILTKGYSLTAPAGSNFVSPVSTFIQNQIEKGSTPEEAIEIVQSQLGTDLDITKDYIAEKQNNSLSDAEKAEFEKLHKVAQVTATILADKLDELKNSAAQNGISDKDLMNVITEEVNNAVTNIVSSVQAAGDGFDVSNVANAVKDGSINITTENLQDKVDVNNADLGSKKASVAELAENEGLLWLGSNSGIAPRLEYGVIRQDSDNNVDEEIYFSNADFDGFELQVSDSTANLQRALTADGWVTADDTIVTIESRPDGAETLVTATRDLSLKANMKKVDVSGLNVKKILAKTADDGVWTSLYSETLDFPQGTYAYNLKMQPEVESYYTFNEGNWCTEEQKAERGGMCNSVAVETGVGPGTPATSLDQIFKDVADGDVNATAIMAGISNGGILVEIVAGGVVNFYTWDYMNPVSEVIAVGQWTDINHHDKVLRKVIAPEALMNRDDITWNNFNRDDGSLYLTVVDGFVRVAGEISLQIEEEYVFGANTVQFLKDSLPTALTFKACLASLEDASYVLESGHTITYGAQKSVAWVNDGALTEYIETMEYMGNNFSWASAYTNIYDMPAWVAATDGSLDKTLFKSYDVDFKLLAMEELYYDADYHYGEEGLNPDGSFGWWGGLKATLPAKKSSSSKLLNYVYADSYEKVSLVSLKNLDMVGGSFNELERNVINYSETYEGKESVTVEAGTFDACRVTEKVFVGDVVDVNTRWYINRGYIKQEMAAPSWAPVYNREALYIIGLD
ncbi:hypothetical protein [Aliivibrio fischeri]|uniref:hypothetical protein n=1 Tax=Aliivibrio fischeri TaxID=668 RepID=UPI0012DA99A2|nr:hypothetical protein [Aliivibrio fischeri]MUK69688.1 hypothetical protein [Aliivibrio fischeri]MUK72222.1 hypothetical protein [Aliivibrio fischeri]